MITMVSSNMTDHCRHTLNTMGRSQSDQTTKRTINGEFSSEYYYLMRSCDAHVQTVPYSRDYHRKYENFRKQLQTNKPVSLYLSYYGLVTGILI